MREEINRAERLKDAGKGRRANTVEFTLAVLQHRLASSPEAILRSIERRRRRLEKRRQEVLAARSRADARLEHRLAALLGRSGDLSEETQDDLTGGEREQVEEEVVDAASAAQTVAELDKEITLLAPTLSGWPAGSAVPVLTPSRPSYAACCSTSRRLTGPDGSRRKILILTEHRDTLNYLVDQVRDLLGRDDAWWPSTAGSSGTPAGPRRSLFTQDKDTLVLVATEAAGEPLNLLNKGDRHRLAEALPSKGVVP